MIRYWVAMIVVLGMVGFAIAEEGKPKALAARGIDLGGKQLAVYVARDKEAWEKLKADVGGRQDLPIGVPAGESLDLLDGIDFEKQMIVAVFWGEHAFAGRGERCWIEGVEAEKEAMIVQCRAELWGGRIGAAYRAWPYHVLAIPRSPLPVRFTQTTVLLGLPDQEPQKRDLATLAPDQWKAGKGTE